MALLKKNNQQDISKTAEIMEDEDSFDICDRRSGSADNSLIQKHFMEVEKASKMQNNPIKKIENLVKDKLKNNH